MSKLPPQTKSFIVIFTVAILGTYLSLWLTGTVNFNLGDKSLKDLGYQIINYDGQTQPANEQAAAKVNTSDWKTYTDSRYNFSFKYKPDWKVLPAINKGGFYVLQIDPGKKYYNIRIFVSPNQYLGIDGLQTQPETIGNQAGLNVKNLLYGAKSGGNYFTFDIGFSLSLQPEFMALVHSVQFQ